MPNQWFKTPPTRTDRGMDIVRIAVGIILIIHAISRLAQGRATHAGFGEYLGSEGFPFGVALAWLISFTQLFASIGLIFGRFMVPACISHICILITGIILIHASEGWYVVGGGRNGMEFSIILLACLSAILWTYWPRTQPNAG